MAHDGGILYVLTNPVMPGLVKVGFTRGSVKRRIEVLSSTTGVPVPFECTFAAKVPSISEKERILQKLFDKDRVNPKREFFRVDPERVVLAIKMGSYEEVTPSKPALDPQDEKALKKAKEQESRKMAKFTFASVSVPVGAVLRFTRDKDVRAVVQKDNKVKYNGQLLSIGGAAKLALRKIGKNWLTVQGPMYWMYKGKTLHEMHVAADGQAARKRGRGSAK